MKFVIKNGKKKRRAIKDGVPTRVCKWHKLLLPDRNSQCIGFLFITLLWLLLIVALFSLKSNIEN